MGQSKRYKGKPCAYCAREGSSSTNDHVVARAFFLPEDQVGLPQVPACSECNVAKSALENYVATMLMIGSRHEEAERYRRELVKPRLERNAKLQRAIDEAPQKWMTVNGIYQPMHELVLDANRINDLMRMIVAGLFRHHFGAPLGPDFYADVTMFHPDHEAALWARLAPYFPPDAPRHESNLGRGSFMYSCAQNPKVPGLTAWELIWHRGIRLYGQGAPPEGVGRWWGITRPTAEKLAKGEPLPSMSLASNYPPKSAPSKG